MLQRSTAVVVVRRNLFLLIFCASSVGFIVYVSNHHRNKTFGNSFLQWDYYYNEETNTTIPLGPQIIGNPNIHQDDPAVLSYIQEFYLTPPSTRPYALTLVKGPNQNPSQYGNKIMSLLRGKKSPGFFIEAGANDGEYLSNTLQLERKLNWSGLLIEPNPFMLAKLRFKNRKAWIAGLCLSLEGYPQKVRFVHRVGPEDWTAGMGIIQHSADNPVPPQTKRDPNNYIYAGPADCFPLYSILLALNQTVVDYFSLDIEGIELKVLKAIPFDLVTIKVFSIEYNLIPEGEQVLRDFLTQKGYRIVGKVDVELFAVHQDFFEEFGLDPNLTI